MKKAIIIGATSGIGLEVAKKLLNDGWQIGAAGRRETELQKLQALSPERISIQTLDVTADDAVENLQSLITKTGGMDLFLLSSGVGKQNPNLQMELEMQTVATNAKGFTQMVNAAFHYFKTQGKGHLAIISSIAGTKGIGVSPAYSATKRFQNIYMESLEQLARTEKLDITFTDIRPGFVATALLNESKKYPMLMRTDRVAQLIVRAINRKKRVAIIDWRYRILVAFWRLIPQWLWVRMKVSN